MPNETAPIKVLADAAGPIQKWSSGWYLFGAQAVMLWGRPRLTADVDVTVRLPLEATVSFCEDMGKAGFRLRISDSEFLARTRVLPFLHVSKGRPKDLEDVRSVLTERQHELDISYIRRSRVRPRPTAG